MGLKGSEDLKGSPDTRSNGSKKRTLRARLAELLYQLRPLLVLALLRRKRRWAAWWLALGIDAGSTQV